MSEKDLPSRREEGDPVEGFLKQVAKTPPPRPGMGRARLIFAMDATASREPTWDRACRTARALDDRRSVMHGHS